MAAGGRPAAIALDRRPMRVVTVGMNRGSRAGAFILAAALAGPLRLPAAAARDLPRGRAAPAARTGCEMFGVGFQKVEGSDTCVRISGSVELDAIVRTGSGAGASFFPGTGKR